MTEASSRPLHCVFYSHAWAIHMLKHAELGEFDKQVLIELATQSNFAPVFGLQGKARYGLGGLLQLGGRLEQLSQALKYAPAPVVLAPSPQISAAALCSAVSMLPHTKSDYETAVVLVHISEAPQFIDAYAYMSSFRILWDVADEPSQTLAKLAELLVENQCISQERWRGFKLYRHPNRPLPDANERQMTLQQVLNEYPLLSGHE